MFFRAVVPGGRARAAQLIYNYPPISIIYSTTLTIILFLLKVVFLASFLLPGSVPAPPTSPRSVLAAHSLSAHSARLDSLPLSELRLSRQCQSQRSRTHTRVNGVSSVSLTLSLKLRLKLIVGVFGRAALLVQVPTVLLLAPTVHPGPLMT